MTTYKLFAYSAAGVLLALTSVLAHRALVTHNSHEWTSVVCFGVLSVGLVVSGYRHKAPR